MNLSNDQVKTLILALTGGVMHHSRRRLFSENFVREVQTLLDELNEEVGWEVELVQEKVNRVKTGGKGEGIVGWLVIVRHHQDMSEKLMMIPLTPQGIDEGKYRHGQDTIIGTIPVQRGNKQ